MTAHLGNCGFCGASIGLEQTHECPNCKTQQPLRYEKRSSENIRQKNAGRVQHFSTDSKKTGEDLELNPKGKV